jgi:SOS response regulatory protein OraA/RecX
MTREEALRACLGWLARQALTEAEVLRRFARRGVDEGLAAGLAEDLRRWGLIDDISIGRREAEKAAQARSGRLKAASRLAQRGFDSVEIGELLAEWSDESEAERAILLLGRKPARSPAQAARRLAAAGYSEEAIRAALDSVYPGWEEGQ